MALDGAEAHWNAAPSGLYRKSKAELILLNSDVRSTRTRFRTPETEHVMVNDSAGPL